MSQKWVISFNVSITKVFFTQNCKPLNQSVFLLHLIQLHVEISEYFLLLILVILDKFSLKILLKLLNGLETITIIGFVIRIFLNLLVLFS